MLGAEFGSPSRVDLDDARKSETVGLIAGWNGAGRRRQRVFSESGLRRPLESGRCRLRLLRGRDRRDSPRCTVLATFTDGLIYWRGALGSHRAFRRRRRSSDNLLRNEEANGWRPQDHQS